MKAWEIVGYSFDGAIYCPAHVPTADETGCECGKPDANGACSNNCHGYGPNPIFAGDSDGDTCEAKGCGEEV